MDHIKVYPDYQNHPISFLLQKLKIFNLLLGLLKYLEDGISIRKIIKKIDKIDKIDYIEFSEGGDFWTSIFRDYNYISHLHGSSFTFKKNANKKLNLRDIIKRKAELFFISKATIVVSPSKKMAQLVKGEMKKQLIVHIIPYPIPNHLKDLKIKKESNKN